MAPEVKAVLGCTSTLPPRFHPTTRGFRSKDSWNPSRMKRGFLGTDPLNDSYIKDVIAKYTAKYTSQREKGCYFQNQERVSPDRTHPEHRRSFETSQGYSSSAFGVSALVPNDPGKLLEKSIH
ncbi:unnamed protein product [Penicillium palitans]